MLHSEALAGAKVITSLARVKNLPTLRNFLEYGQVVAYAAKGLTPKQQERLGFNFLDWAETWRSLYDDFDALVQADPMLLYEPANQAALEFHQSKAYVRYFRAGNRTSKTQSGYAEHYLVTTGQHKWRAFPPPPASTFIVAGLPFTTYAPGVFQKKFLDGEDANPLSPMFPIGGKWFYHYDERQHCITIACPGCAHSGKASTCPHPKSSIRLFSNDNGWEVLQGAAYQLGHFDEHVDEDFFNEARQRTKTVPGGCLLVTGTPLHGFEAWEHRKLTAIVEEGGLINKVDPANPDSVPLVSLHMVDQFTAGLVPHADIKMEMSFMDKFEVDSRVYGKPAPLAKNPVFDRFALQEMEQGVCTPQRGSMLCERAFQELGPEDTDGIEFSPNLDGPFRIWHMPQSGETYIAAIDTAGGLSERTARKKGDSFSTERTGDASCCSILRVYAEGLHTRLEMVAQWHGWLTPYDYADEVFKVCAFYNSALAVIEVTGGLGLAVVQRLKNDHCYWNIYRDAQDRAAVEFRPDNRMGVDTNMTTKPFMISALKQFIKERKLKIYDSATIQELTSFEQEDTGKGGSLLAQPKYRGAGGAKDDRVMSLAIGSATAITYAPILLQLVYNTENKNRAKVSKDMQTVYHDLEQSGGSTLNG